MKRTTVRIGASVVSAAFVLGLAGCGLGTGNQEASTELSDEPVTLRMYWWGGDARHERTQQVIDLFEEEHSNITVEPEFADWSGYWDKLATSTAGKDSPDVVQMDQLYLASYADRGSLVDLGEFGIGTEGMSDSLLGTGLVNDGQYGMPISTSSMAIGVNTDLLDEIGVPLPDNTDSWTWEEYSDWAQKVTDAGGGSVYGATLPWNEFMVQIFARQNGDSLFEDGNVAVDPATMEGFFQTILDMTESGASAPASEWAESNNLALDQTPFSVGTAASSFIIATQISAYSAASGANLELVPVPNVSGGADDAEYFKAGMYWSVSSQSEHPAEAAELIDFFLNDPEAVAIIGTERGLPGLPATLEVIGDSLTDTEKQDQAFTEELAKRVGDAPEIVPNGASDIDAVTLRYMSDVLFGRTTPAEAAEAYIDELQASIDAAA